MRTIFRGAATFIIMAALGSAALFAQIEQYGPGFNQGTTTTVTGATGMITQLNYGPDGTVSGFLVATNTLLTFPTPVTGGIATLGKVGDSVTYSGTEVATSSGFETVRVSSFTDGGKTYTPSTTVPVPVTYPATSGSVKQLNYDSQGNIDGFLFTAGATTILVATPSQASATLKPVLTVGVTVSVTGISEIANPATCTSSGALAVVEATSLTINDHTYVLVGGFGGGGPRPGPYR